MMMMHFFRIFPLLPMIPALLVFGLGMTSLYFGKKLSSPCLKTGGFVMSIGTLIIILLLMVACVKVHMHPMGPMMGGRCPMMEMMKNGGMMHEGMMNNGMMMDDGTMNNMGCGQNCPMMNQQDQKPMPKMPPQPMHPMMQHKK